MDNAIILNEKTLNRIPPLFFLLFLLLLGCPAIAINYFGVDFESFTKNIDSHNELDALIVESQIRAYFLQVLLQWSAFSLSAITILLAFTQHRLTHNKVALVIGLALLFSGATEALHTLIINALSPYIGAKDNLDTLMLVFTNSISGIIFIVGLLLVLKEEPSNIARRVTDTIVYFFLIWGALITAYYGFLVIKQPALFSKNSWPRIPYESIYLSIYLVLIFFIYPKAYKNNPNLLTNCILYIAITHIVIAIYLIFLSNNGLDNASIVTSFLEVVIYFIPFSCLVIHYVFSYQSILKTQNQLQINQEKFRYIASHDSLTNLFNRRGFENLLDKTVSSHSRYYDSFALFLIDIDNFKLINDTHGHIHGDDFLKKLAEQLTTLTRQNDIISRIGGDEFTIITPKLNSPSSARKLADRVIAGLNIPYVINDNLLPVTVSIGISIYPIDGENSEDLLKTADIAMYNAKKSGKNNYQFYTEKLSKEQHREAEIESYLHKAIETKELYLVYQPQYNLITNEIIGAEILLRWNNSKLGDVSPEEFIAVAENSNLIVSIGHWVMRKTCEQAMQWSEKYKKQLLFSINVSPSQFSTNHFYLTFKQLIDELNFPAEYLMIEITENLLMKNNHEVSLDLTRLSALGTKISLDDFGMGYSSFSRLRSLPIHMLKIDKSFVADVHNETDKIIIIDTILKLAHELGMTTIAEGIENQAQLNYLISRQCAFGQGYFLNKPLPAEQFEKIAYL